ncbi:TPA: hypothetical protein N0F65_001799 [Lagenidium giganteum]|uniref:DNA 5'-3' helicase n=1 Tax=Lagenidium giganteum TaxID=4803 RepID=A0AAV2Z6V7_9STRA|nr:TPA: hypothetical protein N0F65_001799 [Lagenidium giganteum]
MVDANGNDNDGSGNVALRDRASFSFPYEPYDIQVELMRQLYDTLSASHVGIFESPTGTGKSMSLICGALTWLKENTDEYGLLKRPTKATVSQSNSISENASSEDADKTKVETEEPAWLAGYEEATAARDEQARQAQAQEALSGIEAIRKEPKADVKKRRMMRSYNLHERKRKRPLALSSGAGIPNDDDAGNDEDGQHLVDAYDSDAPRKDDDSDSEDEKKKNARWPEEQPKYGIVKIIYCSRTHSQISQFIREIRKTPFAEYIRIVALGSRKNLCTHPAVSALPSDTQMNDRCLDMLQGKSQDNKKKKVKCAYYDRDLLGQFKDHALSEVHDIEDLYQLGEEMSTCAYYGSRTSVPLAQVVAMPYSMLLSKDTRASLGIELEGNIVIVDEAHNLIDAINNTHKVVITNKQLVVARRSLWSYFRKYEKRLKGKNCFYIKQLLSIFELLTKFLKQNKSSAARDSKSNGAMGEEGSDTPQACMMTITDFLFAVKMDHFNLFKILQYLKQSNLTKKLLGFMEMETRKMQADTAQSASAARTDDAEMESKYASPIRYVESLLRALTTASKDGRLLVHSQNGAESHIKFILLNPSTGFEDIVQQARSIILAGGTMQPVSEVIDHLFPLVPRDRIDLFSCGHVIPPENLVGFSLSAGPTQKHLEFTFARRRDMEAVDELGRILINLSRVVPGGIVLFFPSYRFEADIMKRWEETKQLDELRQKKAVFREPKAADQLDVVLEAYAAECRGPGKAGAILMSVVGGKMSEGINFSDELARCVVMVGMPYPNIRDPELVEKMKYLDSHRPGSGRGLFENLCMKAVNQSIGRSIRHQNDHACILLVDHRYSNPSVRKRLPEWIQHRIQPSTLSFGQAYSQLAQFFKSKE